MANVRVSNAAQQSLVLYGTKVFSSTNFTSINPNTANGGVQSIYDETNSGPIMFNGINLIDTYATTSRSQIVQNSAYGTHYYSQINPTITGAWQGISIAANTGNGQVSYSTTLTPETVSFSATPTFSLNTPVSSILLTGNITSFTLPVGFNGQHKILNFCQQGSGSYTVAAPSNVRGLMTVTPTLYKCSTQPFTYYTLDAAWLADSAGGLNQ